MVDIFEQLNENQIKAVRCTEGRIRVVAGAGAGKTKTLATRYAFLVNYLGIDPANILCLTFTNKAAKEMTSRIAKLVSTGNYNDFVCTIHGFCVKFLREEIHRIGYPRTFTILDTEDQKQIAAQVMDALGTDKKNSTIKDFLDEIASRKASAEYVPLYMTNTSAPFSVENTRDSSLLYLAQQLKIFALDFDDLLYFTLYILNAFPDVMGKWQEEMNYIMVDEAQDCNRTDWNLIETLGARHGNIYIVGDPDQAIYEWRGSDPGYFINFNATEDIILNQNYRSTQGILNAANSVIKNNKNRIDKDLFTKAEAGPRIIHFHAKTEAEEAEWIIRQINTAIKSGAKPSDFAVLYRSSHLSRFIEQNLLKNEIPYIIWGGIRFFERKEIKDAIAYLRLVSAGDDLSFLRICNVPARKMGKTTVASLRTIAAKENLALYDALKAHIEDKEFNKPAITQFVNTIEECRSYVQLATVSQLLDKLLTDSGLKKMIREDGDEDRLQNLKELQASVQYYEESKEGETPSLANYLQDIALYTNADYNKTADTVKLMTIHQAKGLEFPNVFVVGLSEGIFPSMRSIRERKMKAEEEERRLMYVAITRARNTLMLTESEGYSQQISQEKLPSRFLLEIKRDLFVTEGTMDPILWQKTKDLVGGDADAPFARRTAIPLTIGDTVLHQIFGSGVVLEVFTERDSVKVDFKGTIRTLRSSFLTKNTDDLLS